MKLSELNAMPRADAARVLGACCAATRWVDALVASRPFASRAALLAAAESAWRDTGPNDWREAMAEHPRIGERAALHNDERARDWSAREQSAATSDVASRAELEAANRDYEARFGHIFLIRASGKSATEILEACRGRMHNSPDEELSVAADELRKIAVLRLQKLLDEDVESS